MASGKTLAYCWELGAGLGHVNRMHYVLEQFPPGYFSNVHCIVRDASKSKSTFADAVSVVDAPVGNNDCRDPSPNYAHILWRSGWETHTSALALVKAWLCHFDNLKPDMVFLDHAPTAAVAAHIRGIPYFHFGNGFEIPPAQHPFPSIMPWQKVKKAQLQKWHAHVDGVLHKVVKACHARNRLSGFTQLFSASNSLIMTHPELDHYQNRPSEGAPQYFPILSGKVGNHVGNTAAAPLQKDVTRPGVFVYLTGDTPQLAQHLIALSKTFDVFGYVPGLNPAIRGVLNAKGIHIATSALSMSDAMARCTLVVCHGGIGTLGHAITHNKPLLLMPKHVEQQLSAFNMERSGRAMRAAPTHHPDDIHRLAVAFAGAYRQPQRQSQSAECWTGTLVDFVAPSLFDTHAASK